MRLAEVRAEEDDCVLPGSVLGFVAVADDAGDAPPTSIGGRAS